MINARTIWITALCAAVAWTGLVWLDARRLTSITPQADNAELAASLDEVMSVAMRKYSITGAVAGAIRNGEVVWRSREGLAQPDGEPLTGETSLNLASISKPLTVWTVLALAEAGQIELDAPINDYLQRWRLESDRFDPEDVTVRRILQHSAGLNIHGFGGYGPGERVPEDVLDLMDSGYEVRLVAEPGTQWRYSGGGYVLLQLMIEDVTGETLDRAAYALVFHPLGMDSTGFDPDRLPIRSAAFAHGGNEIPSLVDVALTAAGGWSSAEDMERFLLAHTNGGGVLNRQSLVALAEPSETRESRAMSYTRRSSPGGIILGHGGNNSTWHGQIYVRPGTGDGFYFFTNTTTGAQLDIDLSCAWLSWATGRTAGDVCAGELSVTRKLSAVTAGAGIVLILLMARLLTNLVSGKRRLSLLPSKSSWPGFIGRMLGVAICGLLTAGLAIIFWFDWIYWRTDVVFLDEIPFREIEWLLPVLPGIFATLALAFWSSPKARP